MKALTFGSLFSGIGGFDLGFERAGMQCLWQCEIDRAASSVLARHWPNTTRYTDVTKLSRPAAVDVLCGGFPCQDLSVAGRRAGLAGARSGLWHEFRRLAGELHARVVVIENVPGLLSSNGGRDFAVLLSGLVELGYRLAWRVLDSQYDRVAQRRRRVLVVGSLGDGRCAEILFEPESLRWDSAPRREAGQGIAGTLSARAEGGGGLGTDFDLDGGLVAGTLQASGKAAGSATQQDAESGLIIAAYGGNRLSGSLDVATTINAHGGTHRRLDFGSETFVAHTLRAEGFDASPRDASDSTLIVADCLTGSWHQGNGAKAGNQVGMVNPVLSRNGSTMGVRRLTPRECERLQAFPDDWTRWTDTSREQKDGPRYKQLGNAVNVNTATWLGERIAQAF